MIISAVCLFSFIILYKTDPQDKHTTKFNAFYTSNEKDAENIQCPIPHQNRVPNYTSIQCVWSTIETLARWGEYKELVEPPLTSRSECKSYASPGSVARVLNKLNIRYEQVSDDRQAGIALIKKAMRENRGCLFNIPGHAMTLVHYDEAKVCFIDNSDRTLAVRTVSQDKFNNMWETWVLVIYPNNNAIANKMGIGAGKLPILENGKEIQSPNLFINPDKSKIISTP